MKEHFLQSPLWEQYEKLEGHTTFRLQDQNFSALAVLETTPLGKYLFCPYGPTVATPDDLPAALTALRDLARREHAFFIRIEPTFPLTQAQIRSLKLHKSHDLEPAHTWVLDLNPSNEDLLKAMENNKARAWRNYQKKHISLRESHDPEEISILTKLLATVSDRNKFIPQSETHLKNQLKSGFATLYIAELTPDQASNSTNSANSTSSTENSEQTSKQTSAPAAVSPIPIAATLVYDGADTRFYAHAAADNQYRKLSAGSTLLIQTIIDAKAKGLKNYDFWGITTSNDHKHPWYGFTTFKKSFGGHQVDYAGTYDLPLQPLRYHIYLLVRQLNRLKRKLFH